MALACVPVCACNYTMKNTGIAGCNPLINVTRKVIFVPRLDKTGARNSLSLSTALTQTSFDALVNQADASKRWFPLPKLIDTNDKRADAVMQKYSDDRSAHIRDGVRTFEGMIWGKKGSPILKAKIESARCIDIGVYLVDRLGNITGGSKSADGTLLYPYLIDSESVVCMMMFASDNTQVGLKVSFNFDPDQLDSCITMIKADEMGDADLLSLEGLKDVYATFSGLSTTTATVKLFIEALNPKNPITVQGLLIANFISAVTSVVNKLRNSTTNLDVTISSVTEDPLNPGTYALVFPAQTTANKIIVNCLVAGYDFTNVVAAPFTIP